MITRDNFDIYLFNKVNNDPNSTKICMKNLLTEYNNKNFYKKNVLYKNNGDGLLNLLKIACREEKRGNATEYNYKLLNLFGDTKSSVKYVTSFIKQNPKNIVPFFNACYFSFPDKSELTKIHVWNKLAKKHCNNKQFMDILKLASKIEINLGEDFNSNTSLKKILDTVLFLTYDNLIFKNLKAAEIFKKFNMEKQYLELYNKLTPSDDDSLIPNITFYKNEYTIRKLSSENPIAAVLGNLTKCCQSIDKLGAECTIYGITKKNSGFYAIFKNNKIVAQTWAWREKNTIVFDSIEYNDAVFKHKINTLNQLVIEFSDELIQHKKAKIEKILIGSGGKTPQNLGFPISKKSQVKLSDYKGYIDSDDQRQLSINLSLIKNILKLSNNPTKNNILEKIKNIDSVKQWGSCYYYFIIKKNSENYWPAFIDSILKIKLYRKHIHILPHLKPNHLKNILETRKDKLNELIPSIYDFNYLYVYLSYDQFKSCCPALTKILLNYLIPLWKITNLSESVSIDKKSIVVNVLKDQWQLLIKNTSDIYRLFEYFRDIENRNVIITSLNDQWPLIIKTTKDYCDLNKLISSTQFKDIFHIIKDKISSIIFTIEDIIKLSKMTQISEYKILIKTLKENSHNLIDSMSKVITIYNNINETKRKLFLQSIESNLPMLIKTTIDYSLIRPLLNNQQTFTLINSIKEKIPSIIKNKSDLQIMKLHLSQDCYINLLQKFNNSNSQKNIYPPNDTVLIESKFSFFNKTQNDNEFPAINNPYKPFDI
ncbi:hypothetical protein N9L02_02740 [Gammaproteobacteria bacterium]|nr:hypothetical protein [Gammaproteobacteria bacterium]